MPKKPTQPASRFERLVAGFAPKLEEERKRGERIEELSLRKQELSERKKTLERKIERDAQRLAQGAQDVTESAIREARVELEHVGDLLRGAERAFDSARRDAEAQAQSLDPYRVGLREELRREADAFLGELVADVAERYSAWLEQKLGSLERVAPFAGFRGALPSVKIEPPPAPAREELMDVGGGRRVPVESDGGRHAIREAVAELEGRGTAA